MKRIKEDKNRLEWSITIFSGILVCLTLGFLIYQLIYEEATPPNITIFLGEVSQKDGAFAIPIKASNQGSETGENVVIEVTLEAELENENFEIIFAYLPGKSSAKDWVIFTKRPETSKLNTHVKGYRTP